MASTCSNEPLSSPVSPGRDPLDAAFEAPDPDLGRRGLLARHVRAKSLSEE